MTDRFAACVDFVLAREGGYVCDPADPGGATNLGVTIDTLSAWRGKPCTRDDVLTLGEAEARAIYKVRYWNAVKGSLLPAPLDLATFDAAVNSGVRQAVMWMQRAASLVPDGAIGPRTLRALRGMDATDAREVAHTVCAIRLAAMRRMHGWPTFGRGWTARLTALRAVIDAGEN